MAGLNVVTLGMFGTFERSASSRSQKRSWSCWSAVAGTATKIHKALTGDWCFQEAFCLWRSSRIYPDDMTCSLNKSCFWGHMFLHLQTVTCALDLSISSPHAPPLCKHTGECSSSWSTSSVLSSYMTERYGGSKQEISRNVYCLHDLKKAWLFCHLTSLAPSPLLERTVPGTGEVKKRQWLAANLAGPRVFRQRKG